LAVGLVASNVGMIIILAELSDKPSNEAHRSSGEQRNETDADEAQQR
jgi:hypothetical protein